MAAQAAGQSPARPRGVSDCPGVSGAFVRRLVLTRPGRYYEVGEFVRFRPVDLDAFVEVGRSDSAEPWVPARSPRWRFLSACHGAGSGHAREAPERNSPAWARHQTLIPVRRSGRGTSAESC